MRFLAALVFTAGASLAQAQDVIKLKGNKEVTGKILRLDGQGLTYSDSNGKTFTLKNDEFTEFILKDVTANIRAGDASVVERNYDKAIARYTASLEDVAQKKCRDLHKQFIYFKLAGVHRAKGDTAAALETLRTLRKECGDCRLRADSFRESLDIARSKQDTLLEVLNEMKSEPEPLQSEAELELARMSYEKSEFDKAQAVFARLAEKSGQTFTAEAKLWNIRCLRALNRTDQLEAACSAVLSNPQGATAALIQAASTSKGNLLMKQVEKDKGKIREALLAYAQAISVGPPTKEENPEDYGLALLNGAKCYVWLADGATKPEVKEDYKKRAIGYLTEIVHSFKVTDLCKAAEKELAALGVVQEKPSKKEGE